MYVKNALKSVCSYKIQDGSNYFPFTSCQVSWSSSWSQHQIESDPSHLDLLPTLHEPQPSFLSLIQPCTLHIALTCWLAVSLVWVFFFIFIFFCPLLPLSSLGSPSAGNGYSSVHLPNQQLLFENLLYYSLCLLW